MHKDVLLKLMWRDSMACSCSIFLLLLLILTLTQQMFSNIMNQYQLFRLALFITCFGPFPGPL
jgi:hypothetical protein